MSLSHIAGQPVVKRRGKVVCLLGADQSPQKKASSYPGKLGIALAYCLDRRDGISSRAMSAATGMEVKLCSTYLCRLEGDGILWCEGREYPSGIFGAGAPMKIYRTVA